jgi:hypothetical protein
VSVGGFTLDAPDWVGFAPVTLKGRWEGLSAPVDMMDDETLRGKAHALGLDTLTINAAIDLAWHESDQTMAVGPASLDVDGVGKIAVAGNVGGVAKSLFENPMQAEEAMQSLDFRGVSVSLQDGGAFARLLDMAAKDQNTTRAKLAQQASQQVQGGLIAFLGMEDAAKKVGTAVKAFITDPKSLRVVVQAIEPIPAIAFTKVSQGDEEALSLIKKSISVDATANQ